MTKTHNNFSDMQTYFFDHFVDEQKFIDRSFPVENETVKNLLKSIVEETFGLESKVRLLDLMILNFEGTDLLHGTGPLSNRGLVTFYYFQNEDIGVAAVANGKHDGNMIFSRFKSVKLEDNAGGTFVKKEDLNMN